MDTSMWLSEMLSSYELIKKTFSQELINSVWLDTKSVLEFFPF